MMYDVVLLGGGDLEPEFRESTGASAKAFIEAGGKMMVQHVLDVLKEAGGTARKVLVAPPGDLPGVLEGTVDVVAPSGRTIVASLRNGLMALPSPSERILVVPCDIPLITREALEDFLARCEATGASFCYSYVSRDDSEKAYPGLHHTYARLREGVFCGGSLVLLSSSLIERCERLSLSITAARKNPLAIAGILGIRIIVRLLTGMLSVSDCERRFSELLGSRAVGIRSNYAEVAFNVDEMSGLKRAREILEKRGKKEGASKGF